MWPRAEMVGSVWWGDAILECVPVALQSHGVQNSLSFVTGSEASTNRATRTKSPWMVLGIQKYSWTYIAPWIIHGTCMDIQGSSMDIQRSSMWIHGSSMCVHGLQNNPWTMHGRYMPDQWDSVFSTMVHVGEKGIMLQACLTSFWLFSFWKKTTGPTEISTLTSAFPLWSMLKKLGQVPNPFKIILILCILKEAKLVPNGFGIWPLLFRFYPCWKNMARIQTLFWNSFVLAHFERGQTGPKGVWNLIFVFPLWSIWKKCCQVPNPFWKHLGPFHFERNLTGPNGGLEPDLCFSILVHVGKSASCFGTDVSYSRYTVTVQ